MKLSLIRNYTDMLEIDGISASHFENPEGRVIYRTLGLMGASPNILVKTLYATIEHIKSLSAPESILYWRRKPVLILDEDATSATYGLYTVTCRLAISPDLSATDWNSLSCVKEEGSPLKQVE